MHNILVKKRVPIHRETSVLETTGEKIHQINAGRWSRSVLGRRPSGSCTCERSEHVGGERSESHAEPLQ